MEYGICSQIIVNFKRKSNDGKCSVILSYSYHCCDLPRLWQKKKQVRTSADSVGTDSTHFFYLQLFALDLCLTDRNF